MTIHYFLIISAAVNAFIYHHVLIKEGHIMYPWHSWLTKKLTTVHSEQLPDKTPDEVKSLPGWNYVPVFKVTQKRHWILKPLGDCPLCMCGQIVLWGIVAIYFLPIDILTVTRTAWHVITMICASILLVYILQKLSSGFKQS